MFFRRVDHHGVAVFTSSTADRLLYRQLLVRQVHPPPKKAPVFSSSLHSTINCCRLQRIFYYYYLLLYQVVLRSMQCSQPVARQFRGVEGDYSSALSMMRIIHFLVLLLQIVHRLYFDVVSYQVLYSRRLGGVT